MVWIWFYMRWWHQVRAGLQEVFYFAKKPGPTLSSAPDHQRVGAGRVKDVFRLFRRVVSPLAMIGMHASRFTAAMVSYSARPE